MRSFTLFLLLSAALVSTHVIPSRLVTPASSGVDLTRRYYYDVSSKDDYLSAALEKSVEKAGEKEVEKEEVEYSEDEPVPVEPPYSASCFDNGPVKGKLPTEAEYGAIFGALGMKGVLPGTSHIGKWWALGRLGEGYFSDVYLAHDGVKQYVALKVIKDVGATPNWKQEYELQKSLADVSAATKVLDIFDTDSRHGFVLEAAEGGTLDGVIAYLQSTGGITPDVGRDYLLQLAKGLAAIHAKKVAIRDLHPGNVLVFKVNNQEVLKYSDFGHAVKFTGTGTGPAKEYTKKQYRPFETRTELPKEIDLVKADIFTLGMIVWDMFSDDPAYSSRDREEIVDYVPTNFAGFEKKAIGKNWPAVRDLALRMLDKEPAKRPSLAEFIKALEAWQVVARQDAPKRGPNPYDVDKLLKEARKKKRLNRKKKPVVKKAAVAPKQPEVKPEVKKPAEVAKPEPTGARRTLERQNVQTKPSAAVTNAVKKVGNN